MLKFCGVPVVEVAWVCVLYIYCINLLLLLFGDVCYLGGCDVRTGIVVIARMSCDI